MKRSALTGVLALCLLAGCGADPGGTTSADQSTGDVQSISDAYGHKYVSTGVTAGGKPHPLVEGSRIRVWLEKDTIGFDAGCNGMGAEYRLHGDRVLVDGVSSTEVGCQPELMNQDDWLAGLITASPTLAVDGDRLTLTSGDTVVSMLDVESAEPDRPLAGTRWLLESYGGSGPDDTVASMPSEVRSTLLLRARRILAGQGCNGAGGAYTVAGDTLRVRGFATQLKACDSERMMVEHAVQRVLTSRPTVAIAGDVLTLTGDGRTLTYRAR